MERTGRISAQEQSNGARRCIGFPRTWPVIGVAGEADAGSSAAGGGSMSKVR